MKSIEERSNGLKQLIAILGCPFVMFGDDIIEVIIYRKVLTSKTQYSSLSKKEQEIVCLTLFNAINW